MYITIENTSHDEPRVSHTFVSFQTDGLLSHPGPYILKLIKIYSTIKHILNEKFSHSRYSSTHLHVFNGVMFQRYCHPASFHFFANFFAFYFAFCLHFFIRSSSRVFSESFVIWDSCQGLTSRSTSRPDIFNATDPMRQFNYYLSR